MSPSANSRHEIVSARLRRALDRAGLPEHEAIGPMAIDLAPSYRIPDLIVVTGLPAAGLNPLPAQRALLVVEIESASSTTDDRITKPAQYAAYGIPVYLRVETEPDVRLVAYELRAGETAYTELGAWGPGETAHLERPFVVDIPIDEIAP